MKPKLLVFSLLCLCLVSCASDKPDADHKLLLVSFDGLGHDYLTKTETPNFDLLVEEGVTSEGLIPVFPSMTFPNYYAIATGLYPENNGIINNNMYDPEMDASFSLGNREAVANPEWYQGEPIWNTVEKNGKKAGTMFWVGSDAPIQSMRPTFWKAYDGSVPDSARIDTVMKWLTAGEEAVDFSTLYFSFVDSRGHRYGPDSPEVTEAIERADDLVGYLVQRMKEEQLFHRTNILVVSDHGMAEVSRERLVVLDDYINPEDVEIVAYSPAVMMNAKPGKLEEVYRALKQYEDHFRVYKKEEIPERYHLKDHRRVPELLMVAELGYTINTRDYLESRPGYPSGGAHGFDNRKKEMHAFFLAHGSAFKENYKMNAFENVHLYSLMTHLLDIQPSPSDGSLDSISVILDK